MATNAIVTDLNRCVGCLGLHGRACKDHQRRYARRFLEQDPARGPHPKPGGSGDCAR